MPKRMKPRPLHEIQKLDIEHRVRRVLKEVEVTVVNESETFEDERWKLRRKYMVDLLMTFTPVPGILKPVVRVVLKYLIGRIRARIVSE